MPMILGDASWDDEVSQLCGGTPDVYFSAAYHHLHEIAGDGAATASIVGDGDGRLIVPGLRVPIPGTDCWDLQSCNGYGGPLAHARAVPSTLGPAWKEWAEESRSTGGVAGFFRLHPLLDNARWLPADAVVRDDRSTVYVPLAAGLKSVWAQADSRHRNMVNRGRRSGPPPEWNSEFAWESFPHLYCTAMERVNAPARLRFGIPHFSFLRSMPGVDLVSVTDDAGVVAAAIFLFGARWAHYHLAARRPDAANYVGNVILQAGIERACMKGLDGLHLGGGVTSADEDPLLRFKRSLGGELRPFRIARVVCNQSVFERLATQAGPGASDWLLPYRRPSGGG